MQLFYRVPLACPEQGIRVKVGRTGKDCRLQAAPGSSPNFVPTLCGTYTDFRLWGDCRNCDRKGSLREGKCHL